MPNNKIQMKLKRLFHQLSDHETNELAENMEFVNDLEQTKGNTILSTINPATGKETLEIHLHLFGGRSRVYKIR